MPRGLVAITLFSMTLTLSWSACSDSGSGSTSASDPAVPLSRAGCDFIGSGFGPAGAVPVHADKVIIGLEVPWSQVFLSNGDELVTERAGRLRLIQGGTLVTQPVMTVQVATGGEQGLLGLALDPQFAQNSWIYVYNTVVESGKNVNRVDRYVLGANHQSASFDKSIIDGIPAGDVHDGGRIKFGPDGNLYVGTGDTENSPIAQDPGSLGGKILRYSGGVATPWVTGVRNVEAFDWVNAQTMIIAEHGPTGEINGWTGHDRVEFTAGGDNFGWPTTYGCGGSGFATAALSWNEAVPPGGAAIFTGGSIPEWAGSFIIGTLDSTHLERVNLETNPYGVTSNEVYFSGTYGRLRDVTQGPDGFLYVTTSNCDGRGTCPTDGDYILKISHN